MGLKIDCYILRARVRGVWFHWVFLCKLNPSEVTEKEVCEGLKEFLRGASFAVDNIDEIKLEKKTFEVNK